MSRARPMKTPVVKLSRAHVRPDPLAGGDREIDARTRSTTR